MNITATRANLRRALLGSPVEAIVSSQLRRGGRNLKAVAAKLALNLSTRVGHKARLIEAGLHNVIVDLFAQSIPQILMTDTARMQITFDAEVSSEQKDEEANVMADMVAKNLDLLVDCAGVIGQLSVDDSVAIKIHDRFPVLDFLLVLVSMARPHSVHMAKLLFAVSKFVKLSWRNQQRAAFHLMNKILWLCQVPPSLASGSDPTLWVNVATRCLDVVLPLLAYPPNVDFFERIGGLVTLESIEEYCEMYRGSRMVDAMDRRCIRVRQFLETLSLEEERQKHAITDTETNVAEEDLASFLF